MDDHARWIMVLLLGVGLLATKPDAVQAGGGWHDRTERRFQERLGVSDEQMKAIRDVHQRQALKGKQLWQQLRPARQELRQLALTGDDPAIAAKTAEVRTLVAQIVDRRVSTSRQVGQILTAEQRQKLASMTFGGHRHRHCRHHHRHHDEEAW
jgi:Spy/CpxP family protein refolding chaperone